MTDGAGERIHERVDAVYRTESRRILATLIRLVGDFDLAEDALHDAFRAALERWPKEGLPANARLDTVLQVGSPKSRPRLTPRRPVRRPELEHASAAAPRTAPNRASRRRRDESGCFG
jgi:predicted RNA polymerase sigma factor